MVKGRNRSETLMKQKDGRKWKKDSQTKWKDFASVRHRKCDGGLQCLNPDCFFLQKFKQINKLRFNKEGSCTVCGAVGEPFACPAEKFVAYKDDLTTIVFHRGNHACSASDNGSGRPVDAVREAISINPNIKPSAIQSNKILTAMRKRKSWAEIDNDIRKLSNKRAVANEKAKQTKKLYPSGDDYEEVKEYKRYTDLKDKFLVYEVNENQQYVFKTSKAKLLVAKEMTDEQEILAEEHCHFDGNVKRCKKFTTLTASTFHPYLQSQLKLATMECKGEDKENVGRFWSTFNRAYKEANNVTTQFKPTGWLTDMATANFSGLQLVYGEEVLQDVHGCEFHYKQSVNNRCAEFLEPNQFKVRKFEDFAVFIVWFL